MCIISFKHRFIFLKTRKVAGTSVEAVLRSFTGPDDIVPCVTPRDEYFSARKGDFSKNYADSNTEEQRYTDLVLAEDFEGAMQYLQSIKPKYVSHMRIGRVEKAITDLGYQLSDFYSFTIERHPYSWMVSSVAYNNARYNSGTLAPMPSNKILNLVKEKAVDPQFLRGINWHMYTQDDQIRVNRVLRYENLQGELLSTLAEIGIDISTIELPEMKTNVRHIDAADLLDDEAKALVAASFAKVFAALDYET